MSRNKSNNNKTPGKSGRGRTNSKPRRKFYDKDQKDELKESTNDPAWYSANPELLRDAASIPFSWPTGTGMGNEETLGYDVVPGVAAIELLPTVGTSTNSSSPINVAASAIYSFVRHANSGHSNYDAPDLMMYLLAMSNIYSFITWCQRLLGVINMYDQRNRYYPVALIEANHVSFQNLRDNQANFRYWLNNFITKAASLAVPATMNVFSRLAFLYSNVYIDGPTVKDQMYEYVPFMNAWYKFGLDSDSRGQLTLTGMGNEAGLRVSVSDIMTYGNNLFDAIWTQEDFGIMSGDILKAYGDNIIKLSPVPVDFLIAPMYDAMVLHQMKNAKLATYLHPGHISQNSDGQIIHFVMMQDDATDRQKRTQLSIAKLNKVLSSDYDQPGPEVVIESTRLMYAYDTVSNYAYTGTEFVKCLRIWTFRNDGGLEGWKLSVDSLLSQTGTAHDDWDLFIHFIKAFKYMPEFLAGEYAENGTLRDLYVFDVWDVDNYAVLSNADLRKMHEAALMSLFAVPAIAKIS